MEGTFIELLSRAAPGLVDAASAREILPLFEPRSLAKGEVFHRPGQERREIGFILGGVVRHYLLDGRGRERTTDFCSAGEFTGSLEGADDEVTWFASVGESELAVADSGPFLAAIGENAGLQKAFSAIMLGYFRMKARREAELLGLGPAQRYERFLSNFPGLSEGLPQYLIASYLGVAPETLSRIRSERR